jgi:hypothetical protein
MGGAQSEQSAYDIPETTPRIAAFLSALSASSAVSSLARQPPTFPSCEFRGTDKPKHRTTVPTQLLSPPMTSHPPPHPRRRALAATGMPGFTPW